MAQRRVQIRLAAARPLILSRTTVTTESTESLPKLYADNPADYIRDKLAWEPWAGSDGSCGQLEVIEAYRVAVAQQLEQREFETGLRTRDKLREWTPGQVIQNWIRVESGHTVGKTKLLSGLTNHFFDCFPPAIGYTYAPSWEQIHDLLWKEIKADRLGRGLPGRVLDLELQRGPDHFVKGRATNNVGGRGTERIQGQHGPFLLFVLDEAEGIPDFIYDAVGSMTSGGVVVVLLAANPRTRTSKFHKIRTRAEVVSFRINSALHPNVIEDREIVPGAVRRAWVETMVHEHCEVAFAHEPDAHTFALPYPVRTPDNVYPPGTIFRPDAEFMFRVLGIAPANIADNTFVPLGRYEAACARSAPGDATRARIGVDVARYGKDFGTVYTRRGMRVWRFAQLAQQDSTAYAGTIKTQARTLAASGVTSLEVRIDAGGGFGGGVADQIKNDAELRELFPAFRVIEVEFGESASDKEAYADRVTELYAEAGESMKGLALERPPASLEADLTEREYKWVNRSGVAVKKLEDKDAFRKRVKRSPDDGDGFVLAVAPDVLWPLPLDDIPEPRYQLSM